MTSQTPLAAPPKQEDPGREVSRDRPASKLSAPDRARQPMRVLGQRRRFLIDPRSQLRAAFLTSGTTLILLILLNLSLHSARQQSTTTVLAEAPEVAQILHSQNRLEFTLVLASSLVFLAGVFIVTVLETHKTAGAAFNLARHLEEIRHGQYATRIRLREDDNLQPLQLVFNEMTRTLEDRAWHEVESLERYADVAETLRGPDEAEALAGALRTEAESRRRLVE